ncbi:MAG TPA: glucose-6-phosphate dehydrogenase [Burkholderiales bacterium]
MRQPVFTPGRVGFGKGKPADPCCIVIFGAAGDLAQRELIPALYDLACQALLPEPFTVVGFSREPLDDRSFREKMRAAVTQQSTFDTRHWERFVPHLHYTRGNFDAPADGDYAALRDKLRSLQTRHGIPDNLLFHLAAPPALFGEIVGRLNESGLAAADGGWRRLVIEKPFGTDQASARALDRRLLEVFDESQIYRVDHFLGKETVQNLLVVRFANPGFEPIWNRNYIDHVQITVAEDIGIGTRAGFYERIGVARDMVQNHLLQLLCITAIEPPVRYGGKELRDETAKVMAAIRPLDLGRDAVRGQYGPGHIDGKAVPGYREEKNVAPDSATATYAALRVKIDNWRWAGVPFYMRTGKRMARKLMDVAIHFKPTPHLMFPVGHDGVGGNILAFRLQPEEGIIQTFVGKQPGPGLSLQPVTMDFCYATTFGIEQPPRAYAWLLHDVMEGDQTLFARADWIYRAWEIVDPLIEHWASRQPHDFPNYAAGSWGPLAADGLLRADGREWKIL